MSDGEMMAEHVRIDAPATSILVLRTPSPIEVHDAAAELAATTGLVVFVLGPGQTLDVIDEDQMAAAGWRRV